MESIQELTDGNGLNTQLGYISAHWNLGLWCNPRLSLLPLHRIKYQLVRYPHPDSSVMLEQLGSCRGLAGGHQGSGRKGCGLQEDENLD